MTKLNPFNIGSVTIDPPLVLAPMAGVSHSPLRRLVAEYCSPGLFFSEMLSARHLPNDTKESLWIKRTDKEFPMAYQIVASSADEVSLGTEHLNTLHPEIIDLNLACPAPTIAGKRKAGGFLLSNLTLVSDMLTALRRSTTYPVTAKIRLGKKPDLVFLQELTGVLEQCRIDAVTLHPRLTTEKLKRRARWDYIGHLKSMTRLPVIGNGDVKSRDDCLKMFIQTGCDGVMIGRAAVQRPWIFADIMGTAPLINKTFLEDTYHKACRMILDYFPKEQALGRIKEFSWYFSGNMVFGHRFAARLQSKKSIEDCCNFIKNHLHFAI